MSWAEDAWSEVAAGWSSLWARSQRPAWDALAAHVPAGARVLDVGCGAGELLEHLAARGAEPAGCDPAPGMLALARTRLPGADLRPGGAESLPWPDGAFDAAVAVNSLQFAPDAVGALREIARVVRPGGTIGVANWAESALNDLDAIEHAVARDAGEEPGGDPDYRLPGGLETLLTEAGLTVLGAGAVDVPWTAPDADTLVAAVLLGEDPGTLRARTPVVLAAAAPFHHPDGTYTLHNTYRHATARRP